MRNRVRAVALLATILVAATCAACGSNTSSRAAALPKPSSAAVSSSGAPAAADVPAPPHPGECRNTPASHLGQDDWVDSTPVIDCSKPHTVETVMIINPAEKLTLPSVKQLVDSCQSDEAAAYFGADHVGLTRLAYPLVSWPSPAQRAAGQNWVRCDVGVLARTHCCTALTSRTSSLRGKLGDGLAAYRVCINELPDPEQSQPLTSCTKPHRAELLRDPVVLSVSRYPSPAVLDRKGRSGCAAVLNDRDRARSLVVTTSWTPKSEWSGDTLYGQCWIHREVGLLPPTTE